jgi:bifunctional aspartokinase / homoserine dehydrogenase 1
MRPTFAIISAHTSHHTSGEVMTTLIMKFGGSSVGTPAALTQVLSIVLHEQKRWNRLILVVSALDGVTDMLLEAAYLAQVSNQRGYRRIAATLRTRHIALVDQLPLGTTERSALQADIDRLLFEMLDTCQSVANTTAETLSPAFSDSISSVGERLSARIIASLLRQNNLLGVAIDGTDIVITDNIHGNANPNMELTAQRIQTNLLPMLDRNIIPVVTGYIGATTQGTTTTMGRGGSDYTASILAVCAQADEVWIWSDVDGMMSADPREIDSAQVIDELSYNEVAELAYFGARILHARMIRPLQDRQIPLRIKNVYKPQLTGTLIREIVAPLAPSLKAVTSIQGIGLTANRSGSLSAITQIVDDTLFSSVGNRADVMISSQSSSKSFLCFIVPTNVGVEAMDSIRAMLNDKLKQQPDSTLWTVKLLSIVTAIGENLDESLTMTAKILNQLNGTHILGLAQGPSRCSLSIIVESYDSDIVLQKIHDLTLSSA